MCVCTSCVCTSYVRTCGVCMCIHTYCTYSRFEPYHSSRLGKLFTQLNIKTTFRYQFLGFLEVGPCGGTGLKMLFNQLQKLKSDAYENQSTLLQ